MIKKIKLHHYINLNNKKFSVKFFNQRLPFIYILFNFFYRMFFVNYNTNDEKILQFHRFGFFKADISLKNEIEQFRNKFFIITKNKDSLKTLPIELEKKYQKDFTIKIKKKISPLLIKLEKYFMCDIFISDIKMWRNYNINEPLDLKKNYYANHFHQDSYTMTLIKLFVNLTDIDYDDGPLEIVPIDKRISFIKEFDYKDMLDYNFFYNNKSIVRNTGKIGDIAVFSSPQVFHKAGIPKNYRDNMQIILTAFPKKFLDIHDQIDNDKLFNNNAGFYQKYTKPYGIIKTTKLFFIHLINKFNAKNS